MTKNLSLGKVILALIMMIILLKMIIWLAFAGSGIAIYLIGILVLLPISGIVGYLHENRPKSVVIESNVRENRQLKKTDMDKDLPAFRTYGLYGEDQPVSNRVITPPVTETQKAPKPSVKMTPVKTVVRIECEACGAGTLEERNGRYYCSYCGSMYKEG